MPSSTSAAAGGGGGAIPAGPPSTLSPNAAPYTLLARQARAPPGRLQDGDASRLIDNNFLLNGEDNSSCSVPLAAQFGMKWSDAVYSSSAHGTHQGSCSSSGTNVSGILKAIKSLSEVLCNNCSDEIELEDHDHSLLHSVIENLQSCLHKAKKQPALSNFPKELSWEEEHSQALIYKKLWFDAERANCALKYQLKQTRVEIDLESSMAHIGGGPRNHSFHLCDMGVDPSNSYGSAITCPLMLKGHPGGRKTHNLLSAADHIQSGDSSVLSRSKGYIAVPENIEDEYFLPGSEETGIHCHVHPGLQVKPSRALKRLNTSTSDGMSSSSYITGRDDILRGSCEFGSSDWEHVLKEEIGST